MIQSVPITLDQIFGTNFKRIPLGFNEMEGTNPIPINESDEDMYSEKNTREQPKRSLPPVKIDTKMKRQNVHRSPVVRSQFEQHIGFRNSFYKNNKPSIASRQRVDELKHKELGLYTKYAQRFNVFWN